MFAHVLIWSAFFTFRVYSIYRASSSDNVVLYWGQSGGPYRNSLAATCASSGADVLVLSFLTTFKAAGDLPIVDFSQYCSDKFTGSDLLNCAQIGEDIKSCQDIGIKVLLSLGGATGTTGFASRDEAVSFAKLLWDLFGAGASSTRPFGAAIIDGFDLDIESGSPEYYTDFVQHLKQKYAEDGSKTYYVSAAPQCVFPDAHLSEVLDSAPFDMVFIQFYNNPCSVDRTFNYDVWHTWAKTAPNPQVKLYLGVPAAREAAGTGSVSVDLLSTTAKDLQSKYASFGGVMIWDASFLNISDSSNYCRATKDHLKPDIEATNPDFSGPSSLCVTTFQDIPVKPTVTSTLVAQDSLAETKSATSTNSMSCSSEGSMRCMQGGFGTCNHGQWVVRACAEGTVCVPSGDSIICDFSRHYRRHKRRSHRMLKL